MSKRSMSTVPPKPVQLVPQSGQYEIPGPRGDAVDVELTAVESKPLPPTPKPDQGYGLEWPEVQEYGATI